MIERQSSDMEINQYNVEKGYKLMKQLHKMEKSVMQNESFLHQMQKG